MTRFSICNSKELGRRAKSSIILMVVGTLALLSVLEIYSSRTEVATKSKEAAAKTATIVTENYPSSSNVGDDAQLSAHLRKLRDIVYSERWREIQQNTSGGHNHCPWITTHNNKTDNTRCDVQMLFQRLIARIPFSYVHFNDGEILAMTQSKGRTDRDMQTLSTELQNVMLQAFKRERPGLVFGLPCSLEFKLQHQFAETILNNSSVERTLATLFINSNYKDSKAALIEYLKRNQDRNVHMVVGDVANMTSFKEHTGLQLKSVTRVPSTNAFPTGYETTINNTRHHLPGDTVIICAGPLGRILGVEWFLQRPETTYLELGSYFDLELLGKSLGARYYNMNVRRPNCGSTSRVQRDILMTLINATATDSAQLLIQ